MGYRVRLLYFRDQIPALDSRGSLAGDMKVGGGAAVAEFIRRAPQGYFIGWKNKLFFVPDTRIDCAWIEDEDEVQPAPEAGPTIIQSAPAPGTVAQNSVVVITAPAVEEPKPPPEPGSIVMDKFGRYSRVPFPAAAATATLPPAAAPPEPSPDEPAHTMTRSPRRRASMSAKHETQPPTSLEAAVAEDES